MKISYTFRFEHTPEQGETVIIGPERTYTFDIDVDGLKSLPDVKDRVMVLSQQIIDATFHSSIKNHADDIVNDILEHLGINSK